jgi:hypothetical protein
MTFQKAEADLAKYHVLHLAIGIVLAAILLPLPKVIGVCVAVFLIGMILPSVILAEFGAQSKWLDRIAVLVGAIITGVVFHLLGKL